MAVKVVNRDDDTRICDFVDQILNGAKIKDILAKDIPVIKEFDEVNPVKADSDTILERNLSSKYIGSATVYDNTNFLFHVQTFADEGCRVNYDEPLAKWAFENEVNYVKNNVSGAKGLYLLTRKDVGAINACETEEEAVNYIENNCKQVDVDNVDYDDIFDIPVSESIKRVSRYRKGFKRVKQLNEGFAIGSYLKFQKGVPGFYVKDQNEDVFLCFEQPMENQVGQLNSATTFKLIGYKGNYAKIVAMVNDNLNGKKSGEIYFVERADLESKAKAARPRMNKSMSSRYAR